MGQAVYTGLNYYDHSPVSIGVENGIISEIKRPDKLPESSEPLFIAPGLIDIQVNGYSSVSFSLEGAGDTAASSGDLTTDDVRMVTQGLWKEGVTTYFPTLTTNSQEVLIRNFSVIAKAMKDHSLHGSIPGFHLEGPYISGIDGYRGAHPKEFVRKPEWKEFMELYKAAGEKILLVTIAPEVEGAYEFIRECRKLGIVVSLGHHNGSADVIKEAIDNGAELSTHLANGCATMIHRHFNPLWPQLADNRLMISIICDGFHLIPDEINVFYRAKGAENIILISDITSYAGLPAGEYKIKTGQTIVKTADGNLRFSGQDGGLYGSAAQLSKGIGHIMRVTGCSLGKAVNMATVNPARLHNLSDRGKLEPGKRADIIMFTMKDFTMNVKKTIVAGNIVFGQ